MKIVDYSASFLTFRIDTLRKTPVTVTHKPPTSLNNARIQLDCHCSIVERVTGRRSNFVLGASCKTERVGVEAGIWTEPNADYMPIASAEYFMAVKTFDRADKQASLEAPLSGVQAERQIFTVTEAFDDLRIDLCYREGEVLKDRAEIISTTLNNDKLVARTTIEVEGYEAVIEYPIKTMNVNERDLIYQTDTGPILLPDFGHQSENAIDGMQLAFAAFNCTSWTEFIIRDRSRVVDGVDVYHYCKPVRMVAKNEVIRLIA